MKELLREFPLQNVFMIRIQEIQNSDMIAYPVEINAFRIFYLTSFLFEIFLCDLTGAVYGLKMIQDPLSAFFKRFCVERCVIVVRTLPPSDDCFDSVFLFRCANKTCTLQLCNVLLKLFLLFNVTKSALISWKEVDRSETYALLRILFLQSFYNGLNAFLLHRCQLVHCSSPHYALYPSMYCEYIFFAGLKHVMIESIYFPILLRASSGAAKKTWNPDVLK